jgi:hypothetical protein
MVNINCTADKDFSLLDIAQSIIRNTINFDVTHPVVLQ